MLSTGVAHAGTYTVSGCRTTWAPDVRNTTNLYAVGAFDLCDQPSLSWLYASFGGAPRINAGDYAGWRFDAPPDTAITSATVRWRGRGDYAGTDWGTAQVNLAGSNSAQPLERVDSFDATDTITVADAQWIRAYLLCHADSGSTCRGSLLGEGIPDNPRLAITHASFVYRAAARRPNRQLRAVYFPFSDSHENASSDPLDLRVRAGMTLHVSRHSLRNGQRLVFTGRILGTLPAAGVAVTLQAKVGRNYRSFRQLRASSGTGGRIRTAYRFERTTGPVRYRFRLKIVRQAGLPFQSGASPVVADSVRP